MTLRLYIDRMSQPSRAVLLFCRVNGIDFEEVKIDISKRQHLTPQFQVMQFLDIWLKHFQGLQIIGTRRAYTKEQRLTQCWIGIILTYGVVQVLYIHVGYAINSVLAPALGHPLNPQAAAEDEKVLLASLTKIESFWLQQDGLFLLGCDKPSIADLSLVCEIMQLEVLDEKDRDRILSPYKCVLKWIDDTKNATEPYFHEVHGILFKVKEKLQKQRSVIGSSTAKSSKKPDLQSTM